MTGQRRFGADLPHLPGPDAPTIVHVAAPPAVPGGGFETAASSLPAQTSARARGDGGWSGATAGAAARPMPSGTFPCARRVVGGAGGGGGAPGRVAAPPRGGRAPVS